MRPRMIAPSWADSRGGACRVWALGVRGRASRRRTRQQRQRTATLVSVVVPRYLIGRLRGEVCKALAGGLSALRLRSVVVPLDFLTDGQVAAYGRFDGVPSRADLMLSVAHPADVVVTANADGFCGFGRHGDADRREVTPVRGDLCRDRRHGDGRLRARKDSAGPDFRSAESVRSAAHG